MAANEVLVHCELLEASGDIAWQGERVVGSGETPSFESFIGALGEPNR